MTSLEHTLYEKEKLLFHKPCLLILFQFVCLFFFFDNLVSVIALFAIPSDDSIHSKLVIATQFLPPRINAKSCILDVRI